MFSLLLLILSHEWNILNKSNDALLDRFNNCLTSWQIFNSSSSPLTLLASLRVRWGITKAQLACTFPTHPLCSLRAPPWPFLHVLEIGLTQGMRIQRATFLSQGELQGFTPAERPVFLKPSSCSVALGRGMATRREWAHGAALLFCNSKEIQGLWLYGSSLKL